MIKTIFDSYATTLQRSWSHDRTMTVGASDIGQCARKVYWQKNEGDPTHEAKRDDDYNDGWGAKIRGTIMENVFWEPAMRAHFGDKLLFAGKDQRTFVSGFLSATPDGLVIDQEDGALADVGVKHLDVGDGDDVGLGGSSVGHAHACFMAECKTSDPRSHLTHAKSENVFQTQVQMGLVRELTEYRPNYSLLSYTDASFWDEVLEFPIPFDPKIFEVAKNRARDIMTATNASELKPEGWIAGGHECEYCPFTRACGIERRSVPAKAALADKQFVAEITDLARAIKQFDNAIDFNTARMRDMQNDLRQRLRSKGVRKIPGVVTWTPVAGRKTYDSVSMRETLVEMGVDIEQFSKIGDPTDRLVITLP